MTEPIPIVLFAYNRPDCLRQTLACLRENRALLIYAFSDGPKTPEAADRVEEVRNILRSIDWCDVILCEREANLGLGVSIRTGVAEVLKEHEMIIVFEDDLICAPGAYDYLCAALRHYKDDHRVMSVTGWTHPRITPKDVGDQPYFDCSSTRATKTLSIDHFLLNGYANFLGDGSMACRVFGQILAWRGRNGRLFRHR